MLLEVELACSICHSERSEESNPWYWHMKKRVKRFLEIERCDMVWMQSKPKATSLSVILSKEQGDASEEWSVAKPLFEVSRVLLYHINYA